MFAKNKQIHRRKSQIIDLRLKVTKNEHAQVKESEELNHLYQNKNYQPPEIQQFETIYESSSKVRRGLIGEDGMLRVGKSMGLRFIDFVSLEYWRCDDKEKNKKRKAMITKQFKGRKRNHSIPLCDEAYHELFELIANKEDTIIESDNEEMENKCNKVVEGFILDLPGKVEISQQLVEKLSRVPAAHSNGVLDKLTGSSTKRTRTKNNKKQSCSVQGVVRRSARLQSKSDAIEEVELPKKRRKTRLTSKDLPSADKEDMFEKTELKHSEQLSVQVHEQFQNSVSWSNSGFGQKENTDEPHLDEECVDEEMNEQPEKRKRRSSIYKDLSLSLGRTSGHNISMPAVVRRSLTGEFVPKRWEDFVGGTYINSDSQVSRESDQ